jgi:hypothetical protein
MNSIASPTLAPRVADVYAHAPPQQRLSLLNGLLALVGPLALVAVAAGAFGSLLPDGRWHAARASIQDVRRITSAQVYELALYLEQKSPDQLARLPGMLSDSSKAF